MKKQISKRLFALLMAICMLVTLSPVTPVAAEETATNETTLSTPEAETETDALAAVPVADLTADCAILNYVDEEVFAAGNHVLRLTDEETLSSYVFLNADGTKTVYYLDEAVKFVDSDGAIREKDVTLALSGTAYTTTRNDISLSIPNDPASGITLLWNGHAVRIIPQGGTLSDTVLDGNSIRYTDYYGAGADLVYTPTLTGVKEDIVLESYTGQNTFTFMLNTCGLNLYSANGRYYLAESKVATDRIELGDLVTFDANGRFSVGTMTSQTVSAGNIYRLTLTVDEEFLTDPDTVYPVSIDPTINVKDADEDTAGSIEDVNIYEGRPNLNADWTYMHTGYYDSTYGKGRILVRLTGFINDKRLQSLSPSQITSATFYLKEATGKASATINLHVLNGTSAWTESGVTWSNLGLTKGVVMTSVNHGRSTYAAYNIKPLVQAWLGSALDENNGFMLCHDDEANASKGFYSSEYSNADYRPYAVITFSCDNIVNLDVIYDQAYLARFPSATSRISTTMSALQQKFFVEFGIWINYSEPAVFTSYADSECTTNPNTYCAHASASDCKNSVLWTSGSTTLYEYHHNNIYNIMLRIPFPDTSESVRIAFIGHNTCAKASTASASCVSKPYLGLTYKTIGLITITNFVSAENETKTVVHEFGHLFHAPDHYGGSQLTTEQIIAETGDTRFSKDCIYGENRNTSEIVSNLTICEGCKAVIRSNREKYDHS